MGKIDLKHEHVAENFCFRSFVLTIIVRKNYISGWEKITQFSFIFRRKVREPDPR